MTMDRIDLSEKAKPLIRKLNIPITVIAQDLGMKYQQLYSYINGTVKCPRDVAQRVMSYLSLRSNKEGINALQVHEKRGEQLDPSQLKFVVPGLDNAMDVAIVSVTVAALAQHFEMSPTELTAQALTLTQTCLRRGVKTLSDLEAALQAILAKSL